MSLTVILADSHQDTFFCQRCNTSVDGLSALDGSHGGSDAAGSPFLPLWSPLACAHCSE